MYKKNVGVDVLGDPLNHRIQRAAETSAPTKYHNLSVKQIHNHTQYYTNHNAAHNGEVKSAAVFAFDDDITGQMPQADKFAQGDNHQAHQDSTQPKHNQQFA